MRSLDQIAPEQKVRIEANATARFRAKYGVPPPPIVPSAEFTEMGHVAWEIDQT